MAAGESDAHRALKAVAADWARRRWKADAWFEFPVPSSGFRADVAACSANGTFTAVIECKQSRADFLRDRADEAAVEAELAVLARRAFALDGLIGTHRPEWRTGDTLFPELDSVLPAGRHDGRRRLHRALAVARRALAERTKFARLERYCSADELWLAAMPGVCRPGELPPAWGWLEFAPGGFLERSPARPLAVPSRVRRAWRRGWQRRSGRGSDQLEFELEG